MIVARLVRSVLLVVLLAVLLATSAPSALAQEGRAAEALTSVEADAPPASPAPHSQPVSDDGDVPITEDDGTSHPDRPRHVQEVAGSPDEPLTTESSGPDISASSDASEPTDDGGQDGELPSTEPGVQLQASVDDPDAPVGMADFYVVANDGVLSVAAPGFLGNDVDLDGEALTATVVADGVDHGSLAAFPDGRFTYTPDAGFVGTDSFSYRMRDASGNVSDPITVTLEVLSVGTAPVGMADFYVVANDGVLSVASPGFLGNDVDLDGEALTATVVADGVDHGSLAAFPDGRFTYTPDAGFVGTDSFSYRMRDASGNVSDPITVTLEVLPAANRAPVAADEVYITDEDFPLAVDAPGVLANDVDADSDLLQVVANTDPSSGSLAQQPDGSFVYTPDADFCGVDVYQYTVADERGATDTASVAIDVSCVNDPPVALDDAYTTEEGAELDVVAADGVLHQGDDDFDVDGDAINVDAFDGTSQFGATVDVAPDGAFTYTPAPGFAGVDTFTYTITDGQGGSGTATVTITVEATANRSIDVEMLSSDRDGLNLSGQMLVTNRSDDGRTVQVIDLDVQVEYRRPRDRTWTVAVLQAGSCQFDPSPHFLVTDDQLVDFSACELVEAVPEDATVRITGHVRILGRTDGQGHADGWFASRTSG